MNRIQWVAIILSSICAMLVFQNCGQIGGGLAIGSESRTLPGPGADAASNSTAPLPPLANPEAYSCDASSLNMRWPMDGTNGSSWFISRYFDTLAGPGLRDFLGGGRSSDGYQRIDIISPYLEFNGASNIVRSAGSGEVIAVQNGVDDILYAEFSECQNISPTPAGQNFIVIQHDNGYRSAYYGLQKGSINFQIGSQVSIGDAIGSIGSNDCTVVPHVEFEVRDCQNTPISVMQNRDDIFAAPTDVPAYNFTQKIIHSAFTARNDLTEKDFLLRTNEVTQTNQVDFFGMHIFMLDTKANDILTCRMKDTNGAITRDQDFTLPEDYSYLTWSCHYKATGMDDTNYIFEWLLNGVSVLERPFTVVP